MQVVSSAFLIIDLIYYEQLQSLTWITNITGLCVRKVFNKFATKENR